MTKDSYSSHGASPVGYPKDVSLRLAVPFILPYWRNGISLRYPTVDGPVRGFLWPHFVILSACPPHAAYRPYYSDKAHINLVMTFQMCIFSIRNVAMQCCHSFFVNLLLHQTPPGLDLSHLGHTR